MRLRRPGLLLFALLLCAPTVGAQVGAQVGAEQSPYSLTLRGAVRTVNHEQDKSEDFITLDLRLRLINTGALPLIFWKRELAYGGFSLSRSRSFAREDRLTDSTHGPSRDLSPEWAEMRKALDKDYPPPEETFFLLPNEEKSFDYKVTIGCPKSPPRGMLYRPSLNELAAEENVWMRVYYHAWSLNLEPDQLRDNSPRFGYSLQNRWKSIGGLWLEDISSEPIKLDLKAIQESKPTGKP